jgi:hypothetical protein
VGRAIVLILGVLAYLGITQIAHDAALAETEHLQILYTGAATQAAAIAAGNPSDATGNSQLPTTALAK